MHIHGQIALYSFVLTSCVHIINLEWILADSEIFTRSEGVAETLATLFRLSLISSACFMLYSICSWMISQNQTFQVWLMRLLATIQCRSWNFHCYADCLEGTATQCCIYKRFFNINTSYWFMFFGWMVNTSHILKSIHNDISLIFLFYWTHFQVHLFHVVFPFFWVHRDICNQTAKSINRQFSTESQ